MPETKAKRGRPKKPMPVPLQTVQERQWPLTGMAKIIEVADFFKCSRTTVVKMIDDGTLAATYVGCDRRVHWESVHAYVAQRTGNRRSAQHGRRAVSTAK